MNTLSKVIFTLLSIAISVVVLLSFATIGFAVIGVAFSFLAVAYVYAYIQNKRTYATHL